MKEFQTEQGHIVFECDFSNLLSAGFGYVCDNSNNNFFDTSTGVINSNETKIYYIPVLDQAFCKSCFEDWSKDAEYYEEDRDYEKKKAEIFRSKF